MSITIRPALIPLSGPDERVERVSGIEIRGNLSEFPDMARITAMLRMTGWSDVTPDNIKDGGMVNVVQVVGGGRVRMIGRIEGEERPAFVVSMVSRYAIEMAFSQGFDEEVDE